MAHPACLQPARVCGSGHTIRARHTLKGIITTSTGVLARSPDLLLCNRKACNLKTSTVCRDRMTSRFPTAAEFASFPPPNYANPTTLRPLAIGVITPMTALVVAFMSCRIYSRTVLTKTLGWDDGIMLLAAVSSIDLSTALFAEAVDHVRREQYHGHHIDVAAVPNGPSPLYVHELCSRGRSLIVARGHSTTAAIWLNEGCSSECKVTGSRKLISQHADGNVNAASFHGNHHSHESCHTSNVSS